MTPLTVLPVLLLLVAAGYCAASDIFPREWLSWFGGGGEGGAGASGSERRDSRTTAEMEGYSGEIGEDEAGDVAGEKRGRVPGRGIMDAPCEIGHQPWRQQPPSASSSQVLRRLSRAAATSAPASIPASTLAASAEIPNPANPSAERWRRGNFESVEGPVIRDGSCEASKVATSGEWNAGSVRRWWGSGGPGSTSPPRRGGVGVAHGSE